MVEKNKTCEGVCVAQCCGMRTGCCECSQWSRHLLRWILGIILLSMVFGLGVKIGEFKSFLRTHDRLRSYTYDEPVMMYDYNNMMDGDYSGATFTSPVSAKTQSTTGSAKVK